jgi:hypothetical protein
MSIFMDFYKQKSFQHILMDFHNLIQTGYQTLNTVSTEIFKPQVVPADTNWHMIYPKTATSTNLDENAKKNSNRNLKWGRMQCPWSSVGGLVHHNTGNSPLQSLHNCTHLHHATKNCCHCGSLAPKPSLHQITVSIKVH